MINYFIAYGYMFSSIFAFIEVILIIRHIYPDRNGKIIKTKSLIVITVSMIVIFTILTVVLSLGGYNKYGATRFLDAKERFYGVWPKAIRIGIICASVIAGRYLYIKHIKRRKY